MEIIETLSKEHYQKMWINLYRFCAAALSDAMLRSDDCGAPNMEEVNIFTI